MKKSIKKKRPPSKSKNKWLFKQTETHKFTAFSSARQQPARKKVFRIKMASKTTNIHLEKNLIKTNEMGMPRWAEPNQLEIVVPLRGPSADM
jgi:hypothetical protein